MADRSEIARVLPQRDISTGGSGVIPIPRGEKKDLQLLARDSGFRVINNPCSGSVRDWRPGDGRIEPESHDVPDHYEPDLKAFPNALARALRLSDPTPQTNRNLDDRETPRYGHQQHVRRKVVPADN